MLEILRYQNYKSSTQLQINVFSLFRVSIAQRIRHQILNLEVLGSAPGVSTD